MLDFEPGFHRRQPGMLAMSYANLCYMHISCIIRSPAARLPPPAQYISFVSVNVVSVGGGGGGLIGGGRWRGEEPGGPEHPCQLCVVVIGSVSDH